MFSVGDRVWVPSHFRTGEIAIAARFAEGPSCYLVRWHDEFWGTLQWWFDEQDLEHEVEERLSHEVS